MIEVKQKLKTLIFPFFEKKLFQHSLLNNDLSLKHLLLLSCCKFSCPLEKTKHILSFCFTISSKKREKKSNSILDCCKQSYEADLGTLPHSNKFFFFYCSETFLTVRYFLKKLCLRYSSVPE